MRISDWSSDVCSSDLSRFCRSLRSSSCSVRTDTRISAGIDFRLSTISSSSSRDVRSAHCSSSKRSRRPLARATCRIQSVKIFLVHRSEEHTSELQSLMRISYAVFCLKKKKPENEDQCTLPCPNHRNRKTRTQRQER